MKLNQFGTSVILASLIFSAFGFGAPIVLAQRPTFLPALACVNVESGWGASDDDISVGRELYTSRLYMWPDSSFTCRLPSFSSMFLRLEFGIADDFNDGPATSLSIYLDGNEIERQTVTRGQTRTVLLDVTGGRSIALEASCTRAQGCRRMNFWVAQIELGARSPGAR